MRTSIQSTNKESKYWPLISQFVVAIQTEKFPQTEADLREVADKITTALNLTVVNTFVHPFTPYGLTLVYVLSQSHLAIHTWPERKVLHIDLVTCTKLEWEDFNKVLDELFDMEASFMERLM